MTGHSKAVSRWLESSYKSWLPKDADPDRLLEEVARALRAHGIDAYEYEESNIRIHYPHRHCPGCGDVVRMMVYLDRFTSTRHRNCPECDFSRNDGHLGPELRQIHLESKIRRRSR